MRQKKLTASGIPRESMDEISFLMENSLESLDPSRFGTRYLHKQQRQPSRHSQQLGKLLGVDMAALPKPQQLVAAVVAHQKDMTEEEVMAAQKALEKKAAEMVSKPQKRDTG